MSPRTVLRMGKIDRTAYMPLFRQVADALRTEITEGDIPRGEYLPVEAALCSKYGVGKATIRDALDILRAEGLVETQRGIGTLVRNWGRLRVENVSRGGKVRFRRPTSAERSTLQLPADAWVAVLTTADGEQQAFTATDVEFHFVDPDTDEGADED